jgi:hypothetical protein
MNRYEGDDRMVGMNIMVAMGLAALAFMLMAAFSVVAVLT